MPRRINPLSPPPRSTDDPSFMRWMYELYEKLTGDSQMTIDQINVSSTEQTYGAGNANELLGVDAAGTALSWKAVTVTDAGAMAVPLTLNVEGTVLVGSEDGTGTAGVVAGYANVTSAIVFTDTGPDTWWSGYSFSSFNRAFRRQTTSRNSIYNWSTALDAYYVVANSDANGAGDFTLGIFGSVYSAGSNPGGNLYGLYYEAFNFTSAAADGNVVGAYITGQNYGPDGLGTGPAIPNLYGIEGDAFNLAGNVTWIAGVYAFAQNSSGTATNLIGLRATATIYDYGAGVAVTNMYGAYIDTEHRSGTITNSYGVYITRSQTAATPTNNWGFYQADTRANYFGGTIDLQNADTTLSRASAGDVNIEGNIIYRAGGTDVPVTDGGTGASDATTARTNLGLAIGTNVQAWDADLDAIAALANTDGNFIVGTGATWTVESGATARTSLGLGSIATQDANNVSITGGAISGITDLALADGGTGASLVDPNADRILFWDDDAGAVTWLAPDGTTVTISGTTLSVVAGGVDHGSLAGLTDDDHTQYSLISSQAGVPASTPSRVGEININTSGALAYVSTGTASAADWDRILVAGDIGANVQAWSANLDSLAADPLTATTAASTYQPLDSDLTAIAALASTDGNFIVGSALGWVAESGATARTSLGLGTGDSPQFTAIELGHATDTTLARAAAGSVSIEGAVIWAGATVVGAQINALTADATPDGAADYVVTYDADAATAKKVLLNNLPGGTSDHGALTGLTDDDHTQYLLIDGTRAMTGNLLMPSGGVINWNSGDITITHSANLLTIAGGETDISQLTINNAFTFPTADGTAGQILITDGSGTLSWADRIKGRTNAFLNGGMDIWQRGTSLASISAGTAAYLADRWVFSNGAGAAVVTYSRDTDVPTIAEAGRKFNYSIKLDCTTADTSVAASDWCGLRQVIEGYNWVPFAGRALVLSFWVKSTKTGTFCVSLKNSGADRTWIGEYTVNSTDTWEYKTILIDASPSAGTWNYTNGIGLNVTWALMVGSTYHGTANTWNTSNVLSTSNQVNAMDSTANNFYITGVQLEVNSGDDTATEFEAYNFTDELACCQRYYCKTYDYSTAPGTATALSAMAAGRAYGTTTYVHMVNFQFRVPMRSTATMVYYNPNTGASGSWYLSGGGSATATTYLGGESQTAISHSANTAISQAAYIHATADAEL